MKIKNKNTITLLLLLIFLFYILINNQNISEIIINTSIIYIKNVLSILFPTIFITNLLIQNNLPYYLNKLGIKSNTYIFILSLLTGCPTNAIIIKNLLDNNQIDIEEAEKVICYTQFNNPIFLYNMLIKYLNKITSIKIIIINYISNIIIMIFLRNKTKLQINKIDTTFSESVINSIQSTINTLLLIYGTIIVFNIIPINKYYIGILEITNGLKKLEVLNISIIKKEILSMIYISFGGLCIITQIKSILKDTLKHKYYYKYRLIHLILSMLMLNIL